MSNAWRALNKLAKWRNVFAGWQLGTRPNTDPESQAVRDYQERSIILRAEVNAVVDLLISKGVFTQQEFDAQLEKSAAGLDALYEKKFPGFKTSDQGVIINPTIAVNTTKGWKP